MSKDIFEDLGYLRICLRTDVFLQRHLYDYSIEVRSYQGILTEQKPIQKNETSGAVY